MLTGPAMVGQDLGWTEKRKRRGKSAWDEKHCTESRRNQRVLRDQTWPHLEQRVVKSVRAGSQETSNARLRSLALIRRALGSPAKVLRGNSITR